MRSRGGSVGSRSRPWRARWTFMRRARALRSGSAMVWSSRSIYLTGHSSRTNAPWRCADEVPLTCTTPGALGRPIRQDEAVTTPSFDLGALSSDWSQATGEGADRLTAELQRGTAEGHDLKRIEVLPIAKHKRGKEVLFWLPATDEWAWVHLTGAVETDPQSPSVERAPTWLEIVELLMEARRG